MNRVFLLIIGYCFGLIATGYIVGRIKGIDIRAKGSGNSGTTNTLRVLGKKSAAIVFAVDVLKCFIPCMLVKAFYKSSQPEYVDIYMLYMAIGVILGHNYPFYLGFKGGKGIASTGGFILALDLRIAAVCLAVFIIIVAVTRYVSLGSLAVVTICFALAVIFGNMGLLSVTAVQLPEFAGLLFFIMAEAYIRHRANIKRLIAGNERKIGSREQ